MDIEEDKKYSYLDEFKIIRTLGAGYHAQVKLGMDDNGNLFAIKRYKKETASLGTLQHELNIMKQLKHENLVQLVDVRENALYKRKDETTYNCFAIILEYIGGGELFDFIADTGKFSEKVSRTYFHQMMNGLHYMHSKGYAHRDIKPENILLAKDFILKLADFGFSCLIQGKDSSGILHTKLGTEGYMAPEVPTKNYKGPQVDIFASGVILFIMYAGNPPFEKASPNDPYYSLIKAKNYATFWKAHSRRRSPDYFSENFKDLFVRMCAFNPEERPSIEAIAGHPWVKKEVCTKNEITSEFSLRLKKLEAILEARRKEEEEKRKVHTQQMSAGNRGNIEVDAVLLKDYEMEQDKERVLNELSADNADDLVLDENSAYASALLKNFFENRKIFIDDEAEEEDEQLLKLVEIKDENDTFSVQFERSFEIEGKEFKEVLELAVKLGNSKNGRLIVKIIHQNGSWLYYKRVAKQIRKLFAYCQK